MEVPPKGQDNEFWLFWATFWTTRTSAKNARHQKEPRSALRSLHLIITCYIFGDKLYTVNERMYKYINQIITHFSWVIAIYAKTLENLMLFQIAYETRSEM